MGYLRVLSVVCVIAFGWLTPMARAQTLEAPIGGVAIPLGDSWLACAASANGWTVDATGRNVRPPAEADAVGKAIALPVAASREACAGSTTTITLRATGRWPVFDSSSIVFSPDDARLEAKGRNLNGVTITWHAPSGSGAGVCHDAVQGDDAVGCAWAIGASPTMGVTAHLPFSLRDTCRVVFHRERLSPEYGTQKLNFGIDVVRPDGGTRTDARVAETFTFRAGSEPRYAFIRGVVDPFDRVVVRVSHQPDEAHYIGASEIRTGAPAAQWSVVLGTGRLRLYGTTTIPTGLYRLSTHDYSGVLSLNFGVISHLTWLDAEGHEGFLGIEGGLLVMGLANSSSATGKSLTQVGGVLGLGVSVPIANRSSAVEASISLHAWAEADITRDPGAGSGGRYALIFGPSISIGNVGVNL
jgi:hypothetical protein